MLTNPQACPICLFGDRFSLWVLGKPWTHNPSATLLLRAMDAGMWDHIQLYTNLSYEDIWHTSKNIWSPKCYSSPTESFERASTRSLNALINSMLNYSNDVSVFLISQARLNETVLIGACTFVNNWSCGFSHMIKLSYPVQMPHKCVLLYMELQGTGIENKSCHDHSHYRKPTQSMHTF